MALTYIILLTIIIIINSCVYANPIYELPNLILLGILITHFSFGILVWKKTFPKLKTELN